jgi:hypothetical protein
MDTSFVEIYQELQWVFSLGYVVILSIVATIFLVKLERATILKKSLSGATSMQQDSILGFAGTVTAFVVFAIFHFGNEMILQGKFLIDFNAVTQSISIPSGAAIVWSGSKAIYTAVHKWWQRVKAGETMNLSEEIKNLATSISAALGKTKLAITNAKKAKAKVEKNEDRTVINRRTGDENE